MHVFLSPHYDDAIYSCGGTIASLVAGGDRVRVLTIMSAKPTHFPQTPLVETLHSRWDTGEDAVQIRRQEDESALAQVGADGVYFPLADCVYRTYDGVALYPDESALWGNIHPYDEALPRLRYNGNAYTHHATRVYAPLGVGNHVDHRIVREWAIGLLRAGENVLFYTDYPYMRDEALIQMALEQCALQLVPFWQRLSEGDLAIKLKAMRSYRSQMSSFWRDDEDMVTDVQRAFSHPEGGYGERFWQVLR